MKLAVVGTGYVGLVVGACLADMGNEVICVENNLKKLEDLKNGIVTIYEPGLQELVSTNQKKGRLRFSSDIDEAVKKSLVIFIAVGTPQQNDGAADLSAVYSVAENIAKSMNGYKVIIDKSTVPVGTAQKVTEIIRKNTGYDFDVVSNPEFLKQGNAVEDFLSPDRVIIGSNSEKALKIAEEIYSTFLKTSNRIIKMDIKSAEMTKYAANSFLAMKISFINEIANLCENVGADIENVRKGIAADKRIGDKFLFPGIGYGGSCFPKDVEALIKTGSEHDLNMDIMKAVSKVNKNQRERFVEKILKVFDSNIEGKTFGVWGLSFKPKTNDMREAPSISIINKLLEYGARVQAYDPRAMDTAKEIFGDKITYAPNSYSALENVDCMLLLTEWNEFRNPDFVKIKTLMSSPIIIDGRNQYNKDELLNLGFKYIPVGRY